MYIIQIYHPKYWFIHGCSGFPCEGSGGLPQGFSSGSFGGHRRLEVDGGRNQRHSSEVGAQGFLGCSPRYPASCTA